MTRHTQITLSSPPLYANHITHTNNPSVCSSCLLPAHTHFSASNIECFLHPSHHLTGKPFKPHLEAARTSSPAAAHALLHGKHEPQHRCCVRALLHSCTRAFTASVTQSNHNKLWINSRAIKGNSHALSHEVAARVVTIPMQLYVCVCVSGFFFPPKTDALGLAIHTPSLNQSGYDETPTIP